MAPRTTYANLADGLQPFTLWDASLADMGKLGAIPCAASGTNAITLTQVAANFSPTITAYQNYQLFSFVPAATSTGAVTVRLGLPAALNLYKADGVTQASTGDLTSTAIVLIGYNSALNGGSGGFQLIGSGSSSSSSTLVPYLNVMNPVFGVTGNGSSDDAPGFRAAYAACPNGGTIFIPAAASTYLFNSTSGGHIIPMSGNKAVSWIGEGWNIKTGGSYSTPRGSVIQLGASIPSTADVFNITGTDIVTGMSFKDFAIVANGGTFGTAKGRDGLRIDNTASATFYCTQVAIDHVFIDNMATGYSIHNVAQQTTPFAGGMAYSRISNSQLMNIRLENVGDSMLIDHNTLGQNATVDSRNVGVYTTTISGGTSLRISNNVFSNFVGHIVVDSAVGLQILNNEFEQSSGSTNTQGAMVDLVGGTAQILGVQISGNSFSQDSVVGNYYPVRVAAATGAYIHDNRISTPSAYGHINILSSAVNAHYYSNQYEAPSGTTVQPTILNASGSTNSQRLQIASVGGGDQVNITGTVNMTNLRLNGATSGNTVLSPTAIASGVMTLPAGTDTLVANAVPATLTNKTLDSAGTGNVLKVSGVTVSAGQFPGETTTGSATAGNVGEYLQSVIASGSAVVVATTGTPQNITGMTITLTAGDWDVDMQAVLYDSAATVLHNYDTVSISTTTGTIDTTLGRFASRAGNGTNIQNNVLPATGGVTMSVPPLRYSVSTNTQLFATVQCGWTGAGTPTAFGILRARRAR